MRDRWRNYCYCCGREVIWGSTEMALDVTGTDDSSVVNFYSCPFCGADYEVVECPDEEKCNYEFWKDRGKESDGT